MIGRRGFLGALGSGALVWPRTIEGLARALESGGEADDEEFWQFVRQQFLIPSDRIYLNNGTLGPTPRPVVDAVAEHTRRVAQTFPPGVAWDDLRSELGEMLDGDPEGFVFPRNTTEAMNFVANGLDLAPGDEVLTTDHEHIGGLKPWELATTRRGASLRIFSLPVPTPSSDALFDAVSAAIGPKTRVLALSHVTFTTGARLPIARIAQACAERGILFAVDGAHPPGMLKMSLRALGGDFYGSSPHKWLLAPQGTGLLYLAPRWRTELWPTLASGDWDDLSLGAQRLNHMGTMDESRLTGLLSSLRFLRAIGMQRIEDRVFELRNRVARGLRSMPTVEVVSTDEREVASGMVSFRIEGVESLALQRHLSRIARIRTRVIGEYDYGWMRLSTHIYNLPAGIDRALEEVDAVARGGLRGEP
jgi:selenocysteine lyase/cysteine desulfurase